MACSHSEDCDGRSATCSVVPTGVPIRTRAIVGPVLTMPCSNDDCPGLDVIEEDTSLQQVLAVYERRRVRITIELHEVTKAALASHFEHCSYLCTTNHIKCLIGRRLVTIEETAWFAARIEISGTNGSTVTDPQPVPHEPCCTNARAPVPLVADGDGER